MTPEIKKLQLGLKQKKIDALIVFSPANISYLTHFTSRDSCFLSSKKANIYFTDSRYYEEAKRGLGRIAAIKKINVPLPKALGKTCKDLKFKKIGFEEKNLSFSLYSKIIKEFPGSIKLIPISNLIEELRQVKNQEEIENVKKALGITIAAFRFIKDFILPGKKEIEIAAELERFIRYRGASGSAFDIIIASGPNSSLPHHKTSERKLKNDEPVLVDIGIDYKGYKTDLTRVFFLGKIQRAARKVYAIVLKAQNKAIEVIKPAVSINKVDATARQYINQRGYGGFFGHNLGHGIGLEVHEKPHISAKEKDTLKAGMLFTVEPGIYLPGKFGIRIEDMVLVSEKGAQVLSAALEK